MYCLLDGLPRWFCLLYESYNEWKSFKLAFDREIVAALLEYNCFDYWFSVLFVNVKVWILLWILTLFSALNISVNITHAETYDSQGLNEKLKLIGAAMKFFSKKLLGHEIFSSMVLWAIKFF